MKLLVLTFLTLLSSAFAAIPIPRDTTTTAVYFLGSTILGLRIYHQDTNSGIKEAAVGLPTATPSQDYLIYVGPTRKNTPLGAIAWADSSGTNIRIYFVTPQGTLGEVSYIPGTGWNKGGDIGFPVQADSDVLYALKQGNVIVVGYPNPDGNLVEVYCEIGALGRWKTHTL